MTAQTYLDGLICGELVRKVPIGNGAQPWKCEDQLRIGLEAVMPILTEFGSLAQRSAYGPDIVSGQAIWTAMLAEPGPGFATGELETVATRADSGWRITGKKIWCRFAQIASHGVLLARTDPATEEGGDTTCFCVELPAAGVRILPIPLASGRNHFDEVLFDAVWVPDANRLGQVGAGWSVSHLLRKYAPLRLDLLALEAAAPLTEAPSRSGGLDLGNLFALQAALRRFAAVRPSADAATVDLDRMISELLARRLVKEVASLRFGASPLAALDAFDLAAFEYAMENGPTHQWLNALGAAILNGNRSV